MSPGTVTTICTLLLLVVLGNGGKLGHGRPEISPGVWNNASNGTWCTCAHAAGVCTDVMAALYGGGSSVATADAISSPLSNIVALHIRQCHLQTLRRGAFRNFVRLEEMDVSYCLVRRIEPTGLPPTLQRLHLRGNLLDTLHSDWLSTRLAVLRVLDVSGNAMTTVADGALSSLPLLEHIDLSRNRLTSVRAKWYGNVGLPALLTLDLSSNNISLIEAGAFQHLPALEILNLSGNALVELHSEFFRGLSGLIRLDVSHNNLTVGSFSGLSALEELHLRGNGMQKLHKGAFTGLSALLVLDLAFNVIVDMERGAFNGVTSLERLDLSGNKLECLEAGWLDGLVVLLHLNLSANRLRALADDCFAPLVSLQKLDLSDNALSALPAPALALSSLAELDVSRNTPLRRLLLAGGRLRSVDATAAALTRLPEALTQSVRTLHLADNAVTTIRCGDADSYPLLALLDLRHNGLSEVEEDALGRLELLATLLLAGNSLNFVPRSLPAGLRLLTLDYNPIVELTPADLKGLPRLRVLSLTYCRITNIAHGTFSALPSLQELDLSGNPLASPLPLITGPLGLTNLRLSNLTWDTSTDYTSTAFPVAAPERLELLQLDGSPELARGLLEDSATLAACGQLRELNLENVGLTQLRPDLPLLLPRLRLLHLAGNPWSCTMEDVLWLTEWLHQLSEVNDRDRLQENITARAFCAEPPPLRGVPVNQLTEEKLTRSLKGWQKSPPTLSRPSTTHTILLKPPPVVITTNTLQPQQVTTTVPSKDVPTNGGQTTIHRGVSTHQDEGGGIELTSTSSSTTAAPGHLITDAHFVTVVNDSDNQTVASGSFSTSDSDGSSSQRYGSPSDSSVSSTSDSVNATEGLTPATVTVSEVTPFTDIETVPISSHIPLSSLSTFLNTRASNSVTTVDSLPDTKATLASSATECLGQAQSSPLFGQVEQPCGVAPVTVPLDMQTSTVTQVTHLSQSQPQEKTASHSLNETVQQTHSNEGNPVRSGESRVILNITVLTSHGENNTRPRPADVTTLRSVKAASHVIRVIKLLNVSSSASTATKKITLGSGTQKLLQNKTGQQPLETTVPTKIRNTGEKKSTQSLRIMNERQNRKVSTYPTIKTRDELPTQSKQNEMSINQQKPPQASLRQWKLPTRSQVGRIPWPKEHDEEYKRKATTFSQRKETLDYGNRPQKTDSEQDKHDHTGTVSSPFYAVLYKDEQTTATWPGGTAHLLRLGEINNAQYHTQSTAKTTAGKQQISINVSPTQNPVWELIPNSETVEKHEKTQHYADPDLDGVTNGTYDNKITVEYGVEGDNSKLANASQQMGYSNKHFTATTVGKMSNNSNHTSSTPEAPTDLEEERWRMTEINHVAITEKEPIAENSKAAHESFSTGSTMNTQGNSNDAKHNRKGTSTTPSPDMLVVTTYKSDEVLQENQLQKRIRINSRRRNPPKTHSGLVTYNLISEDTDNSSTTAKPLNGDSSEEDDKASDLLETSHSAAESHSNVGNHGKDIVGTRATMNQYTGAMDTNRPYNHHRYHSDDNQLSTISEHHSQSLSDSLLTVWQHPTSVATLGGARTSEEIGDDDPAVIRQRISKVLRGSSGSSDEDNGSVESHQSTSVKANEYGTTVEGALENGQIDPAGFGHIREVFLELENGGDGPGSERDAFYSRQVGDEEPVEEELPSTTHSGSHPGMFVLLAVGAALVAALGAALPHLAAKRAAGGGGTGGTAFGGYSRQREDDDYGFGGGADEDIEVRTMTELW